MREATAARVREMAPRAQAAPRDRGASQSTRSLRRTMAKSSSMPCASTVDQAAARRSNARIGDLAAAIVAESHRSSACTRQCGAARARRARAPARPLSRSLACARISKRKSRPTAAATSAAARASRTAAPAALPRRSARADMLLALDRPAPASTAALHTMSGCRPSVSRNVCASAASSKPRLGHRGRHACAGRPSSGPSASTVTRYRRCAPDAAPAGRSAGLSVLLPPNRADRQTLRIGEAERGGNCIHSIGVRVGPLHVVHHEDEGGRPIEMPGPTNASKNRRRCQFSSWGSGAGACRGAPRITSANSRCRSGAPHPQLQHRPKRAAFRPAGDGGAKSALPRRTACAR